MTGVMLVSSGCRGDGGNGGGKRSKGEEEERENQISLVALLVAAIRRSMVSCRMERQPDEEVVPAIKSMEIGWPTDVRHVAHVTFDRFHGFLGLPVEFEVEIPCRVPSASASVFGVSAESMQCCYDPKGNSVPTILLLMQERLYVQGGLKAEGIFRINPENSQEELVREQLNKGIVPGDIDVHCLAGLIKAWFRELPEGVLDCLSPEQVLQCNTEDECVELVKRLLPMQSALLNWAIELMTDVVEEEELNKMNARNIAMVFAPNMTQMSDPLTALMHAVQVMNLLKTLILKTLREREEVAIGGFSSFSASPSSDQESCGESDCQQDMEVSETASSGGRDSYSLQVNVSSGRSKNMSDNFHVSYDSSQEDENDCEIDIEECFLLQLEWKEQSINQVANCINQEFSTVGQATQAMTDSNIESTLSISESKQGSLSTCDDDTCSEASIARDDPTNERSPSKHAEEVGMVVC